MTQPHERETRCFLTEGAGPSGGQLLVAPLESKTKSWLGVFHAGTEAMWWPLKCAVSPCPSRPLDPCTSDQSMSKESLTQK